MLHKLLTYIFAFSVYMNRKRTDFINIKSLIFKNDFGLTLS